MVKSRYSRPGTHCSSVLSKPEVQRLAMWEIVKGNLLNRRATRWTIFAILILTYVHLTEYILKVLADSFFRIKTGECSFLAAEHFELYYRLARSYKKPFLSQLNAEMKFRKVDLALVGSIITPESWIQSI